MDTNTKNRTELFMMAVRIKLNKIDTEINENKQAVIDSEAVLAWTLDIRKEVNEMLEHMGVKIR